MAVKDVMKLNVELFDAAYGGDNNKVIDLLNQGAEINSRHTELQATPLYAAARNNKPETVKLLIGKGADLEIAIEDGTTPLGTAAHNCYSKITNILTNAGANIESVRQYFEEGELKRVTPVHAAISSGCIDDVKILLEKNAMVNSDDNHTPITLAKYNENKNVVYKEIHDLVMSQYFKWLDGNLAEITANLKFDPKKTFEVVIVRYNEDLSWALKEFKEEKVTVYNKGANDLITLPANFEVKNIPNVGWFGGSILYHLANQYDSLADRTLFIQAEPYAQNAFLPFIRYKGELESTCDNIIAKCMNTTLQKVSDMLAGHSKEDWEASKYGGGKFKLPDYTMVEYAHKYINENINPADTLKMVWGAQFAVDKEKVYIHPKEYYEKRLPIFNEKYAIADFCEEKLWDLEFKEYNQNSKDNLNLALFNAAYEGDNEKILKLLQSGAEINSRHTDLQATPIYAAARSNKHETVKLLINKGADLEIPIKDGTTPLATAAYNCNTEATKLLVEAGADKNVKVDTLTPFVKAIYNNCVENVKYFLSIGSDILSDELRNPIYAAGKSKEDGPKGQEIYDVVMNHYWQIQANYPKAQSSGSFEAVVVRYKEDLSWVQKEFKTEKVTVYNKGEDNLGSLPANIKVVKTDNVGWLGGTYLKFIVDNYDNLSDTVLFLQGNPYDTETFLPLTRYKGELNSTCANIVAKCEKSTLKQQTINLEGLSGKNSVVTAKQYLCFNEATIDQNLTEFVHEFIDPHYNPEADLYVDLGAQFSMKASQIHSHPKSYYEKMLPLFNLKCPRADFYLEKAWDILAAPIKTHLNDQLIQAAAEGNDKLVMDLLNQGANVNAVESAGNITPLHAALINKKTETAKLLIDKRANLEAIANNGLTPLYISAFNCLSNITQKLLDKNVNIETLTKGMSGGGFSPLYAAVSSGCLEDTELLLASGANVHSDKTLDTPLRIAKYLKDNSPIHNEIHKLVMEYYEKDLDKDRKSFEVVVVRYKENLDWISKEFRNENVIIYNKGEDDLRSVPSNWEVRKIPNVGWFGGTIMYHLANSYNSIANRTVFLQGNPYEDSVYLPLIRYKEGLESKCVNIIGKCGNTTLTKISNHLKQVWDSGVQKEKYACFEKPQYSTFIDFVRENIDLNYNPNSTLKMVWGAQFAVDQEKVYNRPQEFYQKLLPYFNTTCPSIDFLIEKIWDLIFKGKLENIVELNKQLFDASLKGDIDSATKALELGAEVNSQHGMNATSVYAAARNNHSDIVKLLLDWNADIEMPIDTMATPLYTSVVNCYPDITKMLIDAGANLEVRVDGYTPVFTAIYFECAESLKHLLKAGGKIYSDILTRHEIRTPLSLNSFRYNGEEKTEKTEEIYPIVLNHYWNLTAPMIQKIDQKTKNSAKSFEVVVVRYKEDLDWVVKEFPSDKVTIYNKGPDNIGPLPSNCEVVKIPNVGYLGGTYLKHIVDRYDSLSDRTLFMQGHVYDVNMFLPAIRYKEKLKTDCKKIIAKCVNSTLAYEWNFLENFQWDYNARYKDFVPRNANMIEYTNKYIGNIPLNETIYVTYGAVFAVDKEKIQKCGLEHYQAMLPEFDHVKPMADHYQERLWDPLFDYC